MQNHRGGGVLKGVSDSSCLIGHASKTSLYLFYTQPHCMFALARTVNLCNFRTQAWASSLPPKQQHIEKARDTNLGARKNNPKDQFCPAPSLLDAWSGVFCLNYPESEKQSSGVLKPSLKTALAVWFPVSSQCHPQRQWLSRLHVWLVQVWTWSSSVRIKSA